MNVQLPDRLLGKINVETNNGSINISKLETKDIHTETDNGEVFIKDVKSNSMYVQSDNGKLFFENIEGKIYGESDNGDISLNTHILIEPIEFQTDNGSITITTKKDPENVMINVETDNGKINVFGKSNPSTVFGNGDYIIKLTSDNGDITVQN